MGSVAQITNDNTVTLRLKRYLSRLPLSQVKFAVRDEDGNPVTGALSNHRRGDPSVTDASGIAVLEGDLYGDNVAYTVSATAGYRRDIGYNRKDRSRQDRPRNGQRSVKSTISFSYYKYEDGNYTNLVAGDVIEKGSMLPKADLKNGSYTYLFGTNGCEDAMVTVVINGSDVAYNVVFTAKAVTP